MQNPLEASATLFVGVFIHKKYFEKYHLDVFAPRKNEQNLIICCTLNRVPL